MTAPPPDPHAQVAELETRIFDLVQDARHRIDPHAKMLALDSELVGVARAHSADMAEKGYFAHSSPTGETTSQIIMDRDASFQGLLGENIALQYVPAGRGIDVDATAQRFVQMWLESPKHKENLSYAAYDRSGVGVALSSNAIYVTQLFATPMDLKPPSGIAPNAGARAPAQP